MVKFYNINKRERIEVPESKVIKKVKYIIPSNGKFKNKYRFSICAVDDDGTEMVKNCSEEEWSKFDVPVVEEIRTASSLSSNQRSVRKIKNNL